MPHFKHRIPSRVLQACFWAAMLVTFACAVIPADAVPKISESDKIQHFIAFFTLSVFAVLAFPHISVFFAAGSLSMFGALIELVQMIPSLHRDSDVWDWVMDSVAIAIVLLPVGVARLRRR